jgi:hypothetical protein
MFYQRTITSRNKHHTHIAYLLSATDLVAKGLLIDCRNWLRFSSQPIPHSSSTENRSTVSDVSATYLEISRFRILAKRPANLTEDLNCFFRSSRQNLGWWTLQ